MKIFFSMRHLGSFRMYEPVIREMAARGSSIHLAVGHLALGRGEALGWNKALETLLADHPGITWSWLPPSASTFWLEIAKTIRLWADYLRYFEPQYDSTPKLKARAAARLPPRLVRLTSRPMFEKANNRRRLLAALRTLERALPPVPDIERQLREQNPDVVLITPLIYLGSSQFEVLRSALSLGLRTGFCVGSWDHLSSKALIRDMPHRVFVWNETQKSEAVNLHRVPAANVVVTGAQCYDQWFARGPVRSREEFCRHVGLPTSRPFVLYVCSALFPGSPSEAEFVRRWVQSLRTSAHPELRSAAVLIRPHPARMDQWNGVDLSVDEDVTLYGSNPVDKTSRDDYFESLFYSAAIVGLNTSAFLEGAIVDRPLHTILLPEFHENQEGTLHYRYLLTVGGGALKPARSFEDHHSQLIASLRRPADQPGTNRDFVREFIRPRGLDTPATAVFCDAVEELRAIPAPAAERTPLRFVLLRWAMYPPLRLLQKLYGAELFRDERSRREEEHHRRVEARQQARRQRLREAQEEHRDRERRRADTLATREAARRERLAAHHRVEEEKTQHKRARARAKAARARERERAAMQTRLKQGARRWLRRWRPRGQDQAT
jgi:hypothetical protein